MRLRLATRVVLAYTPQFLAEGLGLFAKHGIDVEFLTGSADRVQEVDDGQADFLVGNLWIAARALQLEGRVLEPIALLNHQCRYLIVGRVGQFVTPNWRDGRSVCLVPSDGPIPWVAMQGALKSRKAPRLISGMSTQHCLKEFRLGLADFLMIEVEAAQTCEYVEVAALADLLGPLPWSVYLAPPSGVEEYRLPLEAFQRSIEEAVRWMTTHTSAEAASVLGHWFGDIPEQQRTEAIERYMRLGMWSDVLTVPEEYVERWVHVLAASGLVRDPTIWRQLTGSNRS